MNIGKRFKLYITIFSILLTSTGLFSFAHTNNLLFKEKQDALKIYPLNLNEQTYGSDIYNNDTGIDPDLILVYGDDGTLGYIKLEDLLNENEKPNTPEEALKYQNERNTPRKLPVYDQNGENIISYFTLSN